MKLNLPDCFEKSHSCLLFGAGGGYDYLGATPFAHELKSRGKSAFIVDLVKDIGMTGVQPIVKYLQEKVDELQIDTLIAVDGGVDSLMRGDEEGSGTILEDTTMLAAISKVEVKNKILICMGFGTEVEEGLCHYRALENIAALTASGGFLGCCSLTPQMNCFSTYKSNCENEWKGKHKSHIHTRIIPAVLGGFGEQTLYDNVDARISGQAKSIPSFVNPLMGICWFFDLMKVYERNLFAEKLLPANTKTDCLMLYRQNLDELMKNKRINTPIPL